MSIINFPILYVPDPTKGKPLFYGQIYVGEPGLDPTVEINQKQLNIVQEDGTVVPVPQPFILSVGGVPVYNGATVRLDVEGNYSLKILDKSGAQTQYYIDNVYEGEPVTVESLINDLSQSYEFETLEGDANSAKESLIEFPIGKKITWKERSTGNGGGASGYIVETASVTPNGYNIIQSSSVPAQSISISLYELMPVTCVGINPNNTTGDDQDVWNDTVANNSFGIKCWTVPAGNYRMSVFRLRQQTLICSKGAVFSVFYGGVTPVMGQINSGGRIHDLNIISEESDLDLQRLAFETATDVIWEGGSIKGFNDLSSPVDAWCVYLKSSSNITLRNIEFDDSTLRQSDIAIVDTCDGISIDNCYSSDGTLHINLEPNNSSVVNKNITLSNMNLYRLDLRENGSGSTATKNLVVNSCTIQTLLNDGSTTQFNSCDIESVTQETQCYMGQYRFINSIGIGDNILEDPTFSNIGNTSGEAATNFNSWYLRSRTGDFVGSGDRVISGETDGGSRYTRINPTGLTGTLVFSQASPITTQVGEVYLIAVTGRAVDGTSGRFLDIFEASFGSDKEYILFRSGIDQSTGFQTDIALIPITVAGSIDLKFGILENTLSTLDIAAISLHKVDLTTSKDNGQFLQIHSLKERRQIATSGKPVMANQNLTGWQDGDVASFDSINYYWDEVNELFKIGSRSWDGTGTPEGVITAPVSSTYNRLDGSAGTSFYVKEGGTGNTGWVAK